MNKIQYPIIQAILLLSLSLFFTHRADAYDLDGATTKDLLPITHGLVMVAPTNLDILPLQPAGGELLKVRAWVDQKNSTYRLKEMVTFYVKANKDCYITLLDIGTTGAATVIFPNSLHRNNYIKAGDILTIPKEADSFRFKAIGQRGKEIVKVIATLTREEIIPEVYLQPAGYFKAVTKDLSVVASHINSVLNDRRNPIEWDEYAKVLTIM